MTATILSLKPLRLSLLLSTALCASLFAAEYFVAPTGDDALDGQSRETAFATVQRGVNALAPGDTLTILPGEYLETVRHAGLGHADAATTIRAEIPGTVLLRGDLPAPAFEKVEGFRFVYAAAVDQAPLAVIEHDTQRILYAKPERGEVEFSPGSFYYDAEAQRLYLSPSNLQTPQGRRYSLGVLTGSGLHLEHPVNVTIEGLAATGFAAPTTGWHATRSRSWGIALTEPEGCTIRNARTWLNYGGIGFENGPDNRVDACVAFANRAHNIHVQGGGNNRDNIIENSAAYRAPSGMHFYGGIAGPVILRNNLAWGHDLDFSNKSGSGTAEEFGLVEHCVGLSDFQAHNLVHTIMAGVNEYDRRLEAPDHSILFRREADLDLAREFADPYNLDFRLQADSRFRGRDGTPDRGPFPYQPNIVYVSPEGDDANDGLDLSRPRRTLAIVVDRLSPGDTVYLSAGAYTLDAPVQLRGDADTPIRIRARGRDAVVIEGGLTLRQSTGVEFERLTFNGPLHLEGGASLSVLNCRFAGEGGLRVRSVTKLTVRNTLFAETQLQLAGVDDIMATANFFANPTDPAVAVIGALPTGFVDYNGYQFADRAWRVGGEILDLEALRKTGHDRYGRAHPAGSPTLAGWGPGTSLGPHDPRAPRPIALAGPFLHRTTDTQAHVEWWTSEPTPAVLHWQCENGQSGAMKLPETLRYPHQYAGFTLERLEPGQAYTVSLAYTDPSTEQQVTSNPLRFTTAETPAAPSVYYVALDGDDRRDGNTRDAAFRTVARAAAAAGAGDTVIVTHGDYPESVWIRAGGTEAHPVTFRSAPGEKVTVRQFLAIGKSHIRIDGFYTQGQIHVYQCDTVAVTRCFSRGPLLHAHASRRISLQNCVATGGYPFHGFGVRNSPDFTVENSVILGPAITGATIENQADQNVTIQRSIFTDSIPFKVRIGYFEVGRAESLTLRDNAFYLRAPDPEMGLPKRNLFMFYGTEAYDRAAVYYGLETANRQPSRITELSRLCLEDYDALFGDSGSLITDPRFEGAKDINLPPDARFTPEDNLRNPNNTGLRILTTDRMGRNLDFHDLFTRHPELIERGIGLQPEAFADFHFRTGGQ